MIIKKISALLPYALVVLILIPLPNVQGCSKQPDKAESIGNCEYICNDNKKCYTKDQMCDGKKDCDDNTDEDTGHCGK